LSCAVRAIGNSADANILTSNATVIDGSADATVLCSAEGK
jgi:hypothetical protein